MKIAIDESGDSGRKFWKGSSKLFIVSAVIVPQNDACGTTCQAVANYREEQNYGRELHFARNSHQQHVDFLTYMHDHDFVFASVVIDKQALLLRKPYAMRSKMALLQYSFTELFKRLHPYLDDPVVLIDTNGPRHFNRALSRHLLKMFGVKHKGDHRGIKQIRTVHSDREPLVQLADYVSGAIHHEVDDRHSSTTFQETLADKGKVYFI